MASNRLKDCMDGSAEDGGDDRRALARFKPMIALHTSGLAYRVSSPLTTAPTHLLATVAHGSGQAHNSNGVADSCVLSCSHWTGAPVDGMEPTDRRAVWPPGG